MLTLFTIPKPFEGPIGDIQLTAVRSWTILGADIQILLLGDETGTAGTAESLGVEHVPGLLRNEHGTPRLDAAFAQAAAAARHPVQCFVNADVVLLDDFAPSVQRAGAVGAQFLMVGRTTDLPGVTPEELLDRPRLRARAATEGTVRGAAAIDYFVFTPRLFGELPPFLVGRAGFDNWLVWRARQVGAVVDASAGVLAVHQSHDYAHLAGGKDEAYAGEEAAWNISLAGGREHLFTIHDASHRLLADGGIRRNYGSILRARETARKIGWKLGRR